MCTIFSLARRKTLGLNEKDLHMSDKLGIGSAFPSMTLNLVDGGTLDLPDGLGNGYRVILFYRGHW